jgi:hypothetical protein
MLLLHNPAAIKSPIRNNADSKDVGVSTKIRTTTHASKPQIARDCSAIMLAEITNFGPGLDILGLDFLSQL